MKLHNCITAFMAGCAACGTAYAADTGTAFSYQGELLDEGSPVTDQCEFEFTLWDDLAAGVQVGPIVAQTIDVAGGKFTTSLDFQSNVFTGEGRWLEIAVCCAPDDCTSPPTNFTTLAPRQELTPVPYALRVSGPEVDAQGSNGNAPNVIAGWSGNTVTLGAAGATISGGGVDSDTAGNPGPNRVTDDFGTVGGGYGNVAGDDTGTLADALSATVGGGNFNNASANYSTVSGGFGNNASGFYSTVGGGIDNNASADSSTVGGGDSNNASADSSTVGGGFSNDATGFDSTVGGGSNNNASGDWSTVGGGFSNDATSFDSTVGGGSYNNASENSSTVGGGSGNNASANRSTVSGGGDNNASANRSTVSGGGGNNASADYSTVGGGRSNSVSADYGTVSGGGEESPGDPATANRVFDDYGTVGGGGNNVAGSDDADSTTATYATIGGGESNNATNSHTTIGGGLMNTATGFYSTVSGGNFNNATGFDATISGGQNNDATGSNSTVSGGQTNMAGALFSTIGGGSFNTTSGDFSTVPGGNSNTAAGDYGLAAGRRAKANHAGAFVWGDSTDADFASTAADQFLIRAGGGVGIGTNNPQADLHVRGTTTATVRFEDPSIGFAAFSNTMPGLELVMGGMNTENSRWGYGIKFMSTDSAFTTENPKLLAAIMPRARQIYNQDTDGAMSLEFATTPSNPGANSVPIVRMTIASNGRVAIGRSPASNELEVEGNASKSTAGSWLANSDRRIKRNIETIDEPLATLDKVRLVNFRYTDEYRAAHPSIKDRAYMNVIAQEFAEVFPNHVKGSGETLPGSDEEILQVDTYPLTIYSAAAIQELHRIVNERDAEIVAMQADVAALKETVRKLSSSTHASKLGLVTPALAALCLVGYLAIGRNRKGGAR